MAFNAKDLSYDLKEPAFLRRLRDQYGGADSDRHQRQIQRPRKLKDNDDDDEPVYVDEDTNETISKEDYESLVKGIDPKDGSTDHTDEKGESKPTEQSPDKDKTKAQLNLAEIGTQKKRKKAKVIQEDEAVGNESQRGDNSMTSTSKTKSTKAAKKKIKLSFDEIE